MERAICETAHAEQRQGLAANKGYFVGRPGTGNEDTSTDIADERFFIATGPAALKRRTRDGEAKKRNDEK